MQTNADELRKAVESVHSCRAVPRETVPVHETFEGRTVWDGVVHVFDLIGHPRATRAFAWSSPKGGSGKRRRRIAAVLQIGPIMTAADAVRAAIVAEHRQRDGPT